VTGLRAYAFIAATLLAAILVTVLPYPHAYLLGRPLWLPLVTGYWCLAAPRRMGVFTAWAAGLLADAAMASPFGEHALALSVFAYMMSRYHLRIRNLPMGLQMLFVGLNLFVYEFAIFWINGLTSKTGPILPYALPVLVSTALWPVVFFPLRRLRRRYRIH
jgi:rod shape-determining protein MreD